MRGGGALRSIVLISFLACVWVLYTWIIGSEEEQWPGEFSVVLGSYKQTSGNSYSALGGASVRYDTTPYDTIQYDKTRYGTIRYDTIRATLSRAARHAKHVVTYHMPRRAAPRHATHRLPPVSISLAAILLGLVGHLPFIKASEVKGLLSFGTPSPQVDTAF